MPRDITPAFARPSRHRSHEPEGFFRPTRCPARRESPCLLLMGYFGSPSIPLTTTASTYKQEGEAGDSGNGSGPR